MKKYLNEFKNHAMTGVSYMIPAVVVGGIGIAIALATGTAGAGGMEVTSPFWNNILTIGVASIIFIGPVLAGYIAYSIAGRPGLVPGLVVGQLASQAVGTAEVRTGFLGALILGFAAGYLANWIKGWKVPSYIKPLMPIFVIPIITTMVVGLFYIYVLANPLGGVVLGLENFLANMGTGSTVVLAIIIGMMIAFDMGGPVNKVAFTFAAGMIASGRPEIMGMTGVAICVPPIGMGLASFISKNRFTNEEREAGKAALAMGTIGITEGAIPFAAADPLRVLPAIMIGSAVGAVVAALGQATNLAPHGGLVVLPVVGNPIWYIAGVIVGSLVVVGIILLLKKPIVVSE